jgi:hypothetical protein
MQAIVTRHGMETVKRFEGAGRHEKRFVLMSDLYCGKKCNTAIRIGSLGRSGSTLFRSHGKIASKPSRASIVKMSARVLLLLPEYLVLAPKHLSHVFNLHKIIGPSNVLSLYTSLHLDGRLSSSL